MPTRSRRVSAESTPQRAPTSLGFAILSNGRLLTQTVSPSERATKIAFLITNPMVWASLTDSQVERLWQKHRGEAEVTRVKVTEVRK